MKNSDSNLVKFDNNLVKFDSNLVIINIGV